MGVMLCQRPALLGGRRPPVSEEGSVDIRQMPAFAMSPKGARTLQKTILDTAGTVLIVPPALNKSKA